MAIAIFRGNLKKKNSIFTDIVQIEVDPPPSYPIFDKSIFDKVLITLTSLPPLQFLTKTCMFRLYKLHHLLSNLTITYYIIKITLKGSSKIMYYIRFADFTETIFQRLIIQKYVLDPLLLLFLSKNNFIKNFWNGVDLPPSCLDNVCKYTVFFFEVTP